jgi:hypothetical protein
MCIGGLSIRRDLETLNLGEENAFDGTDIELNKIQMNRDIARFDWIAFLAEAISILCSCIGEIGRNKLSRSQ